MRWGGGVAKGKVNMGGYSISSFQKKILFVKMKGTLFFCWVRVLQSNTKEH